MFNQWPVIYDLGKWLEQNWRDAFLKACFSRSKDTLYLYFEKEQQSLHLKFEFQHEGVFLFQEYSKFKTTDLVQFPEVINQALFKVDYSQNERSILLHFYNGYQLWIRFYGGQGNIILLKEQSVVKIFRAHLQKDWAARWEMLNTGVSIIPKTNPFIIQLTLSGQQRYQIIKRIKTEEILYTTDDVAEALSQFARFYFKYKQNYEANHAKLVKIVHREKLLQKNLVKYTERLDEVEKSRPMDELGHIIIANLHMIEPASEGMVLQDFYHDQQLYVKLNPRLSPQQNAEALFRKNKNQKIEVRFLQESISKTQQELSVIHKRIEELKYHLYDTPEQSALSEKRKIEVSQPAGIKIISVEGYEIWVGKSSEANDRLTHQYSHKNDIWFHAFGVSGSHVIIKNANNKIVPPHIIIRAASLAAYYSKAKHSAMVPVVKTLKKYVRRQKGANPGQVIVERYDTIDVVPEDEA